MNDTTNRDNVAEGLRELAVSLVDTAALIRDGSNIDHTLRVLHGCHSCLHLAEMALLAIDQRELRSET